MCWRQHKLSMLHSSIPKCLERLYNPLKCVQSVPTTGFYARLQLCKGLSTCPPSICVLQALTMWLNSACTAFASSTILPSSSNFLVDIWIGKGRCISQPSGHSLTMDVIAGRIGLAGTQNRVDWSQGACGHLAKLHLPLLSTRKMHSPGTGRQVVCPAQKLACKASAIMIS